MADRAEHDIRNAVEDIIARGRQDLAEYVALEIHQAYLGRGWTPPAPPAEQCEEHPNTKPVGGHCPICGPKGL